MIRWLERWALKRADRREGDSLIQLQEMLAKVEDGRMTAEAAFGGPAVQIFMAAAIEWFRKTGGENYVTCEVIDKKTRQRYQFTMQRMGGKSPVAHLNERINLLKDALTDCAKAGYVAAGYTHNARPSHREQMSAALLKAGSVLATIGEAPQ